MRILAIAAHPDDEVLGCGATLAALSASHPVAIAILGEGITSRYTQRAQAKRSELARLGRQAKKAASVLGASLLGLGGLPDNRFDSADLLDIVKRVEAWISQFKPDVIYTHHPGDLNIDHVLTFKAVLAATRLIAGKNTVKELYAFEVPSSSEWSFQKAGPAFAPNVFRDVTLTLRKKIKALAAYEGEMRRFPHPRSAEALEAMAKRWGSVAGLPAAEAFELVRMIG